MQRGHESTHPLTLDMPEGFDPAGIPHLNGGRTETPLLVSHRSQLGPLAGLPRRALIASVMEIASKGDAEWLLWGCAGDHPVLFAVEAGAAAEMMASVARGETATAIVEPGQVVLERLD